MREQELFNIAAPAIALAGPETVVFTADLPPRNTPGTAAPRKLRLLQPRQVQYPGTNRNAACPCGSGKKYKKCCLA